MLIACKCLNITLTANNLPSEMPIAASISNYDDSVYKIKSSNANQSHMVSSTVHNQRDNFEDNHDDQPPYIQCSTIEHLETDQLQFFRTVNTILIHIRLINSCCVCVFLHLVCFFLSFIPISLKYTLCDGPLTCFDRQCECDKKT